MIITLRDYQAAGVQEIRRAYVSGSRSVLYALPTGGGKTAVFCWISEQVAQKKRRVNILVHRQELLLQTSEHLTKLGVSHGIIAPGHTMTGDLVQVSSVHTLARRIDKVPEPDLLILDEAHHAVAGTWIKILTKWQKTRCLGVTATPCRLDGKGLGTIAGGCFDAMVEGPTIQTLIAAGHLAPPILYAPPTALDLTGITMSGGDFLQRELSGRVDKKVITGSAVEHYQKICPGVPAICFCASIKHAEHVTEEFNAQGIASASLTGEMNDSVRKYRIRALASGEIKVLTSCEIISEGTDVPVVGAAILLRPTCSLGLYLQQVGRSLRMYPGKTAAIILDHVGNVHRHGLPDDIRSWSLNGSIKKPKKKADEAGTSKIRQCEKCYAVFSIGMTHCPQCGSAVAFKAREYKQVEGKLEEVIRKLDNKITYRREVSTAKTLDDLLEYARQKGYKPGWAYHIHNSRASRRQAVAA